jgi:hypothetical protein
MRTYDPIDSDWHNLASGGAAGPVRLRDLTDRTHPIRWDSRSPIQWVCVCRTSGASSGAGRLRVLRPCSPSVCRPALSYPGSRPVPLVSGAPGGLAAAPALRLGARPAPNTNVSTRPGSTAVSNFHSRLHTPGLPSTPRQPPVALGSTVRAPTLVCLRGFRCRIAMCLRTKVFAGPDLGRLCSPAEFVCGTRNRLIHLEAVNIERVEIPA